MTHEPNPITIENGNERRITVCLIDDKIVLVQNGPSEWGREINIDIDWVEKLFKAINKIKKQAKAK